MITGCEPGLWDAGRWVFAGDVFTLGENNVEAANCCHFMQDESAEYGTNVWKTC